MAVACWAAPAPDFSRLLQEAGTAELWAPASAAKPLQAPICMVKNLAITPSWFFNPPLRMHVFESAFFHAHGFAQHGGTLQAGKDLQAPPQLQLMQAGRNAPGKPGVPWKSPCCSLLRHLAKVIAFGAQHIITTAFYNPFFLLLKHLAPAITWRDVLGCQITKCISAAAS